VKVALVHVVDPQLVGDETDGVDEFVQCSGAESARIPEAGAVIAGGCGAPDVAGR